MLNASAKPHIQSIFAEIPVLTVSCLPNCLFVCNCVGIKRTNGTGCRQWNACVTTATVAISCWWHFTSEPILVQFGDVSLMAC